MLTADCYNSAGAWTGQILAEEIVAAKSTKGDVFIRFKVAHSDSRVVYNMGFRVVVRKGLAIRFQGTIQRILASRDPNGMDEITVTGDAARFGDLYAGGTNQQLFMHDNKLIRDPKIWLEYDGQNSDNYDLRAHKGRLMCFLTSTSYASLDAAGWTYATATGGIIRKCSVSYSFTSPNATNWKFYAIDQSGTTIWSGITAPGSSTVSFTSSGGWQSVTFLLQNVSGSTLTPSANPAQYGFKITACSLYGNVSGDSTANGAVGLIFADFQSQCAGNGITPGQLANDTSAISANTTDVMPLTTDRYAKIGDLLDAVAGYGFSGNIPAEYGLATVDVGQHQFYYRPANVGQVRYILANEDAANVDVETTIQDSYNAAFATYTDAAGKDKSTATNTAAQDNAAPVQRTLRIDVGKAGSQKAAQAVALAIQNSGVQRANGSIPITQPVRDLLRGWALVPFDSIEPGYCIALPEVSAGQLYASGVADMRDGFAIVYISAVEYDFNAQKATLTVENPLNDLARFLATIKQ